MCHSEVNAYAIHFLLYTCTYFSSISFIFNIKVFFSDQCQILLTFSVIQY